MFSGGDSSLSWGCLFDFYAFFKGRVRLSMVLFLVSSSATEFAPMP